MVFGLVKQSLTLPLQVATTVAHMGYCHLVTFNAGHDHRSTHLCMAEVVGFLVDGITDSPACHLAKRMTAHAVTYYAHKAIVLWHFQDVKAIFIIASPTSLADCCIFDFHCLLFLHLYSLQLIAWQPTIYSMSSVAITS